MPYPRSLVISDVQTVLELYFILSVVNYMTNQVYIRKIQVLIFNINVEQNIIIKNKTYIKHERSNTMMRLIVIKN